MRRLAALGFVVLAGSALLARVLQEPHALPRLGVVYAYVPDFRTPFRIAYPEPHLDVAQLSLPGRLPWPDLPVLLPTLALREATIVIAGDTGLNASFQPVYAGFAIKNGYRIPFADAETDIAPVINGDVNFANLETVVTDRNDLTGSLKLFGFRTHPDGVKTLLGLGFNIFSTANNHSMDYGLDGATETLRQLKALGAAHAGLGATREEAAAAQVLERRGIRFAFGGVGIGGSGYGSLGAGEHRPGQLVPTSERDVDDVTHSLTASGADFKVFSAHYGTEFEVFTAPSDRAMFHRVLASGVDMVVGHHQHVVAGVEIVDGKPVFYGLGNFLHFGTQDMSQHDMCHDYGLVARVHLAAKPGERLSVRAIEAIPVTGMHIHTRRMAPETSAERVQTLNYLSAKLGPTGVRFAVEQDGTGLYCGPGSEQLSGSVGALCAAKPVATEPPPSLAGRIAEACSHQLVRMVEDDAPSDEYRIGLAGSEMQP
jgi:poly-gamma-glutamate synthesis protein (capsule biosynthesis protein)